METVIVNELAKQATWSETQVRLHLWRVSGGAEVDVVLERDDGQVVGVEAKARDTVTADDFRGLAALRDLTGDEFTMGVVFPTGRQGAISFGDRLVSLPVSVLWHLP
ncbi:DUF4143 domain-containing protein [Allokutzneria oryzae]|uniref:DUF4143 domain-containing protein n=1 Tax=Allokutzneria oryzae TaxID=1378989 RepID=A0ABV5ZYA6_9PSEU